MGNQITKPVENVDTLRQSVQAKDEQIAALKTKLAQLVDKEKGAKVDVRRLEERVFELEEEARQKATEALERERQLGEEARNRATQATEKERELTTIIRRLKNRNDELEEAERERQAQLAEEEQNTKWRNEGSRNIWDEPGMQFLLGQIKEKCDKMKTKFNITGMRLLVAGLQGSGKSSLINSIHAATTGTYATIANAADTDYGTTQSCLEYTFEIETPDSTWLLPFTVLDFRGLGHPKVATDPETVIKALYGHLENGTRILPKEEAAHGVDLPVQPSQWEAQLLLIVQDASTIEALGRENQAYIKQLKSVMQSADSHEIPTVIFLTKCDSIDESVRKNQERLHKSQVVEEAVHQASVVFGRNSNRIFPVKNFTDEVCVEAPMAAQFLFPISSILDDLYARLKVKPASR